MEKRGGKGRERNEVREVSRKRMVGEKEREWQKGEGKETNE